MSRIARILVASAAILMLAACGEEPKEPEFPNPLLTRVPADTPYVLATGEPVAESVNEAWRKQFEPTIDLARDQFDSAMEQLGKDNPALAGQLSILFDEILKLAKKEEREKIGLTRDDRLVIYGHGLMPVVRMSVTDPEAFRSFLTGLGNKSGIGMGSTTFQGQEVSRLAVDPVVILGAIEDGVLSVGVTGRNGEQAMLEHLFAPEITGATLADGDAMPALVDQYGFLSAAVGYMDVPRLVALSIGDGDVPGLLDDLGAVPEELTAECRGELVSLAGKAPRLVFGYDELSETAMALRSVFELEPGIAEAMTGWTAPVPGLGSASGARWTFGMSLDGTKAAQSVKSWMAAAAEREYACGFLAETPWKEASAQINVAPLYMVGNPKGFLFQLHDLEIRDIQAQDFTVSASAVAVFDNAQTLSGMVRMMAPPLQAMDLPTDGTPVRVPAEAMPPAFDQPVWLASTETTLATALGQGAEERVSSALNAEAPAPAPLVYFDFDAGWFYNMLADWMPKIASMAEQSEPPEDPAQGGAEGEPGEEAGTESESGESEAPAGGGQQEGESDNGISPEELAELEKAAEMMRVYGEILDRVTYHVSFTDRGVEIAARTTLKQ